MKLRFWGTRGSIPTPGRETVRYGGNTPCVELRLGSQLVILDAGTGLRGLGESLIATGESIKSFIVITHPHWDHIQGFPFFKPVFVSGNEFTIVGPQSRQITLQQLISDLMNKVYFPIQLNELKANIEFHPVKEETIQVFDAQLRSCYVNHPAFAVGYRIDWNSQSIVYISDNEPFDREVAKQLNVDKVIVDKYLTSKGDPNQRIFDFARDADVLIHDATYTPEEYVNYVGWGHSHYLFTLKVACEANVKKLVLFHHHQSHSDEKVDEIVEMCRREIARKNYSFECVAAAEGMEIEW